MITGSSPKQDVSELTKVEVGADPLSRYFAQPSLWDVPPERYQIQVASDLRDMVPPDVGPVLDVGCGNGHITHALADRFEIVGLDPSVEALTHLRVSSAVGAIEALPFKPRQFDLVTCNDVLEHLEYPALERGLSELARVASRFVLITVPHGEDLAANSAICAQCSEIYHINGHLRSFSGQDAWNLKIPGFRPVQLRFSGERTVPPPDPTVALRHAIGAGRTWSTHCPRCGSSVQRDRPDGDLKTTFIDAVRAQAWGHGVLIGASHNPHSEVIVLFARDGVDVPSRPHSEWLAPTSLAAIDFANGCQQVQGEWRVGSSWSRFELHHGALRDESGVTRAADVSDDTPVRLSIRLPFRLQERDRLQLCLRRYSPSDVIRLIAIEPPFAFARPLEPSAIKVYAAHETHDYVMDAPLECDRFGAAFDLYLSGSVRLLSLNLERPGAVLPHANGLAIHHGPNVIRPPSFPAGWELSLLSESAGRIPSPQAGLSASEGRVPWTAVFDRVIATLQSTRTELQSARTELQSAHNDLNLLRNDLLDEQSRRLSLETALAEFNSTRHDLEVRLKATLVAEADLTARLAAAEGRNARLVADLRRGGVPIIARRLRRGVAAVLRSAPTLHRAARQIVSPFQAAHALIRSKGRSALYYPDPWHRIVAPAASGENRVVLVVSHMYPHPDQPGSGVFVHEQVRALRERGVDARVVSARPYWIQLDSAATRVVSNRRFAALRNSMEHAWWDLDGVPIVYVPYRILGGFELHAAEYASAVLRAVNANASLRATLVHAHTSYLDGTAALQIQRHTGAPFLITEHTGPFDQLLREPKVRAHTQQALSASSAVVCVSNAQAADVARALQDDEQGKLVVIPNGVDTTLFRMASNWVPDAQRPRLMFVGYLVSVKNVDVLLRAFRVVHEQLPGATLTIIGDGEERAALSALAVELGIDSAVNFWGYLSRQDVSEAMRQRCDLLVLPSRSETFGCVLAEALCCGRPVVATQCGGPQDIVEEPRDGTLCRVGDVDSLAKALLSQIDSLPSRDSADIAARARARFGFESVAQSIARLQQHVLATCQQH